MTNKMKKDMDRLLQIQKYAIELQNQGDGNQEKWDAEQSAVTEYQNFCNKYSVASFFRELHCNDDQIKMSAGLKSYEEI